MKIIYCLIPREDTQGVFWTVDTISKGGSGGSTPFDQKPTSKEIETYLSKVYPEMTDCVWHLDTSDSADEIQAIYF